MFENFKKIKIKGGCFAEETELELFKKDPVTVVYGRNGSGKTTIAHCIQQLAAQAGDVEVTDFSVTADVAIPEEHKGSIFVFDEDFVRDHVRVSREGINTIVMLGEQVEIDNQIEQQKDKLKKAEEKIVELEALKAEYGDEGNVKSPKYHYNGLWNALREDGGWADMDSAVKGNKMKSKITGDVMQGFLDMDEPADNFETLRSHMQKDWELYRQSENAQTVTWVEPALGLPENLNALVGLLKKPIDKPELSEREQRLLAFVTAHPQEGKQQMVDEKWEFCPLCMRDMKDHDRTVITETLAKLLNKQADEYKGDLEKVMGQFEIMNVLLPEFPGSLYQKELSDAKTALGDLNGMTELIRKRIEWRMVHVYDALETPFEDAFCGAYTNGLMKGKTAIAVLKGCVTAFNTMVNERTKLRNKILTENKQVARKQLASALDVYRQALANEKANSDGLAAKKIEKETIESSIKVLKAQKERTDIALEYINKELKYVFYSDKKVKLEAGEGCYKLKVNGKSVLPRKISVGERNVLGLCYFFAKLYSGKTDAAKYASEYLIVIDDPVSSFDYGNRVGVMSLLRYQFNSILKGNVNSRILVMSHDLHSVFDLVKIRNEVVGKRGDKSFMELTHSRLEVKQKRNEYQKLLQHVYDYATDTGTDDPDETQEISIGNIMRRLMEAFASFNYNDTFEKMWRKEDVLASIPEGKKTYYENFMCRLALNGESHSEESVYSLDTESPYFTRDEKVQTAKSVLLFLLYVNRTHLTAYLEEDGVNTIESWKAEEAGWLVS